MQSTRPPLPSTVKPSSMPAWWLLTTSSLMQRRSFGGCIRIRQLPKCHAKPKRITSCQSVGQVPQDGLRGTAASAVCYLPRCGRVQQWCPDISRTSIWCYGHDDWTTTDCVGREGRPEATQAVTQAGRVANERSETSTLDLPGGSCEC